MILNSAPPHRRLETQLNTVDSKLYFRFDVNNGLQDVIFGEWTKVSEVHSHTEAYLGESENKEKLLLCVDRILIWYVLDFH